MSYFLDSSRPKFALGGMPKTTTYWLEQLGGKTFGMEEHLTYLTRGQLSAHLLSLHNRAGVAGSRSALTSHRLK